VGGHPSHRYRLRRDGHTALMWAVYSGHLDIVRRLVDAKADVDAKDKCAALWPYWV
jgi:hypothetical protein